MLLFTKRLNEFYQPYFKIWVQWSWYSFQFKISFNEGGRWFVFVWERCYFTDMWKDPNMNIRAKSCRRHWFYIAIWIPIFKQWLRIDLGGYKRFTSEHLGGNNGG